MKNKNQWFSLKLFWESFRQLRLIGIVSLILLSLSTIIISMDAVKQISGNQYVTSQLFSATSLHLLLVAVFYAVVPIMMLVAFHFLNQRNGSDFYFAAPVKRECLYLSILSAVLVWSLLLILGSTAVSLLCSLIFRNFYTINLLSFWAFMFNAFAGSVFVAGVFAIAMVATGTVFTNIVVALLLIVMPRILITLLTSSVDNVPYIGQDSLPMILNTSYNVVSGSALSIFSSSRISSLTDISAGIYTVCVGVIYAAIAGLIFHFRKSESAGKSAPNRTLQAIYRLSIALLVTLPCCAQIYSAIQYDGSLSFSCFVLYVIAIVVYFLYELLTTKKAKNMLRAAPGLLILAVLNVAIVGEQLLVYRTEVNFAPQAAKIDSVQICYNGSDGDTSYFAAQSSNTAIHNQKINEIIARNLQEEINTWNSAPTGQKYLYFGEKHSNENSIEQKIIIRCGTTKKTRSVFLNETDWTSLMSELEQNKEFQQTYLNLPGRDDQGVQIYSGSLEGDALRRVYKTMCEEVKNMDFSTWYNLVGTQANTPKDYFEVIQFNAPVGMENTSTTIPLSQSILPKTCAQFFEETLPQQEMLLRAVETFQFDESAYLSLSFYNISSADSTGYGEITSESQKQLFLECIRQGLGKIPEANQPFVRLYYSEWSVDNSNKTAFFPLTEEAAKKIEPLLQQ